MDICEDLYMSDCCLALFMRVCIHIHTYIQTNKQTYIHISAESNQPLPLLSDIHIKEKRYMCICMHTCICVHYAYCQVLYIVCVYQRAAL